MLGQRIGYIRVSTIDQHTERQLEGIEVAKTFTDKASGKDTKRPQFEALMSFVRTGDTVVVHSMDRLARNLDDLRRIVQTLTARGVRIEFVKEHLTFTLSHLFIPTSSPEWEGRSGPKIARCTSRRSHRCALRCGRVSMTDRAVCATNLQTRPPDHHLTTDIPVSILYCG
jgi:Resolvase, N terminal domain